jgi:aconitate hydratase
LFDGLQPMPAPLDDVTGARALVILGDSVTTDDISPSGPILPGNDAGRHLQSIGVRSPDFNSCGTRRGNHEVIIRGTFANPRLRNLIAGGAEGPVIRIFPRAGRQRSSRPRRSTGGAASRW